MEPTGKIRGRSPSNTDELSCTAQQATPDDYSSSSSRGRHAQPGPLSTFAIRRIRPRRDPRVARRAGREASASASRLEARLDYLGCKLSKGDVSARAGGCDCAEAERERDGYSDRSPCKRVHRRAGTCRHPPCPCSRHDDKRRNRRGAPRGARGSGRARVPGVSRTGGGTNMSERGGSKSTERSRRGRVRLALLRVWTRRARRELSGRFRQFASQHGYRLARKPDAIAVDRDLEDAAARRQLARDEGAAFELPRPVRSETAVR